MLSQLLTDFGRTGHRVAAARESAQSAVQTEAAVRDRLLLEVRQTYFDTLRAAAIVHVAERTVEARQLVADQVDALARNGLKSELDARFAAVNVADARLLLADSRNRLQAAEAALSSLTGLAAPAGFRLAEPPPLGVPSDSLDTLLSAALNQRPDLAALRAEQRAATERSKTDDALWRPEISLLGAAGFAPVAERAVPGRYGAAAVNVSIPVFNGGLFRARRQESDYLAQAAASLVREQENRVTRDVRVAWLNLQTARERLQLTAQLVQQAASALDLARGRYDLGLGTIVEFSQAQLNLTSAELAQASARFDLDTRGAELQYQLGATR